MLKKFPQNNRQNNRPLEHFTSSLEIEFQRPDVPPGGVLPKKEEIFMGPSSQEERMREAEIYQLGKKTFFPDKTDFEVKQAIEEEKARALAPALEILRANKLKIVPDKPPDEVVLRTADVIESYLKRKSLKKRKASTIETDEKRYGRIIQQLPFLTISPDEPIKFLSKFNEGTGRYQLDYYDRLKRIYRHAVDYFGLPSNPMIYIERPKPFHKPFKTLSWAEFAALLETPETDTEKACLEMLQGIGWRPVEARRITGLDVRQAGDGIILCHGKEREEQAPILGQILEVLRNLTPDSLPDDAQVIRSWRIRNGSTQPLGEDGFTQLIQRLFARAKLDYKVYDLRRTFGTLVQDAGADYFLTERLLRHIIPGCGNRYIKYPLSRLVRDLQTYSPLEVIKRKPTFVADGGVCPVGGGVYGGDGGESNSPSRRGCPEYPTGLVSSLLSPG
jgi:integrase